MREPAQLDAAPFDSRHRFMAVLTEGLGGRTTHVKGAAEQVLRMCSELYYAHWHDRAEALARRGLTAAEYRPAAVPTNTTSRPGRAEQWPAGPWREPAGHLPRKRMPMSVGNDPEHPFSPQYARARENGHAKMADELLEIAKDSSNDWMLRTFFRGLRNGSPAVRQTQGSRAHAMKYAAPA